jgi:hypothetical protein
VMRNSSSKVTLSIWGSQACGCAVMSQNKTRLVNQPIAFLVSR